MIGFWLKIKIIKKKCKFDGLKTRITNTLTGYAIIIIFIKMMMMIIIIIIIITTTNLFIWGRDEILTQC